MGGYDQDSDDYRLPDGWRRTGYDADSQRYSFKDSNGVSYEGEPGCRYGPFTRVSSSYSTDADGTIWLRKPAKYTPMKTIPDTWTPPEDHIPEEDEDEDETTVTQRVTSTLQSLHQCLTQKVSAAVVSIASKTASAATAITPSKTYNEKPRRSSESDLLRKKSNHSSSQRSSRRSSVLSFRSQSPRDYLLNGPDPKRRLSQWLDENEKHFADQDRRRESRRLQRRATTAR